jgi:hypothetical protein
MIAIKNTENLTGVKISGDFEDLYNLVDALHAVSIDDYSDRHTGYYEMSTRILGLCYDLRHTYQGDRQVELIDNNMDEDKMKWHSIIAPKNNVYYSCNCLYPEMFFAMLALNELVELRIKDLTKKKYISRDEVLSGKVVWDKDIAAIRAFQAQFAECLKGTIKETAFARWINFMNKEHLLVRCMAGQYIDVLNVKYIRMTKEKRLKNLTSIARRIAEYENDEEHEEIKNVVSKAAKEYGCQEGEIRLQGIEYPEDIIW